MMATTTCIDCGVTMTESRRGQKKKHCDACKKAKHRKESLAWHESHRDRPCGRDGCAGFALRKSQFCSKLCRARARPSPAGPCIECGGTKPSNRRTHSTCSDACASARRDKANAAMVRTASKPCVACGAEIRGAPSAIASRNVCGPECRRAWREANATPKKTHPCVVCGKPSVGRKTCSDACFQAHTAKRWPAKSEAARARRNKNKKAGYKRRDKATVVATLTKQQRGRCKACGGEGKMLGNGKAGLVLDHDHVTGMPRAMLCGPCNAALGLLGESPDRIASLRDYALLWAQRPLVDVG